MFSINIASNSAEALNHMALGSARVTDMANAHFTLNLSADTNPDLSGLNTTVTRQSVLPKYDLYKWRVEAYDNSHEFTLNADDDFVFQEGSFAYVTKCCEFLKRFEAETGKPTVMGLSGHLGSYSWGDQPKISKGNPVLGISRGILFSASAIDLIKARKFEDTTGENDDLLKTSIVCADGAVIFKRFKAPMLHKKKTSYGKGKRAWEHLGRANIANINTVFELPNSDWYGDTHYTRTPKPAYNIVKRQFEEYQPTADQIWEGMQ